MEECELRDPSGRLVSLSYRKVLDLLVELAKAGAEGCRRTDLEGKIWPNCGEEAQKVSLRQALNRLRKALGSEAIYADRNICVLQLDVALEFRPGLGVAQKTDSLTADFARLLTVLSKTQPRQALEMLHCCREFSNGISPIIAMEVVKRCLPAIAPDDPLLGIASLWRANVAIGVEGVRTALPLYRSTLKLAQRESDGALARESIFMLGICHILSGDPSTAVELANCDGGRPAEFQTLRAHGWLHLGRSAEAISEFEGMVATCTSSAVELANHQVRLAFYYAVAGESSKAVRLLEPAQRFFRETGHHGVSGVCGLARGYVALRENPESAVHEFTSLCEAARDARSSHFELYAQEGLASAYERLGEKAEARRLSSQSRTRRTLLGFGTTAWDQSRIQFNSFA